MSDELDPVEDLVLEYLQAQDEGRPIDVETLALRLVTEEQRTEFRGLCRAAAWAEKRFPEPLRASVLVANRYRLIEHVGSGGFGKVWRARDEKLGRDVALKLFHALREDDEVVKDLERERRALADLRHDGIVRLLDSGKHEDAHFLAMDFVAGRGLDKVIAELAKDGLERAPTRERVERAFGPPGPREASRVEDDWNRTAARLVIDVLWALSVAHAHGVVHRDLKPGNVLLRGGGKPVLVDFGLAGVGGATGDVTGRLFGTVAYLAPEQIARARTGKDELTDVYQAGLLLYELLTLQRAFAMVGRTALLEAVGRGDYRAPRRVRPAIPRELEDVVVRALERDPARRYPSAEAFRDDLERWLEGQLPRASRAGVVGRTWRRARHALGQNRVAASLVLAMLLGASLVFLRGDRVVLVERMADGSLQVVSSMVTSALLFESVSGDDGRTRYRVVPVVQDGVTAFAVQLEPGRRSLDLPPTVRAELAGDVVAVPQDVALFRDSKRFGRLVSEAQSAREGGLTRQELHELLARNQGPARGGEALGALRLDGLRD